MKRLQEIEGVCNNLADAKDEIRRAIDTVRGIHENGKMPDFMAVCDAAIMAERLEGIRYDLQRVLDMAYGMQFVLEEQEQTT